MLETNLPKNVDKQSTSIYASINKGKRKRKHNIVLNNRLNRN